jgi:ABC-type transport system involved in multi-copper enzyme maturation permease subunit
MIEQILNSLLVFGKFLVNVLLIAFAVSIVWVILHALGYLWYITHNEKDELEEILMSRSEHYSIYDSE